MKFFARIKKEGFLGIAPQELKITLTAVAYIFFVICSYYVIKPIRGSLGMELGKDNIPIMSLLSMFVLVFSNAIYSQIVGMYKRDIFIPFIARFFAGCIIVFWLIFSFVFPIKQEEAKLNKPSNLVVPAEELSVPAKKSNALSVSHAINNASASEKIPELATGSATSNPVQTHKKETGKINLFATDPLRAVTISVFYLWVGVFALFAVSMFWSFMNDVFSVDQSKRLYAIIGYGGLTGGAVGSLITSYLVPVLGTANLFIVALLIFYPSIWCMKYIHHHHFSMQPEPLPNGQLETKNTEVEADESAEQPVHPPRPWDGMLSVYRTPILIFMALEMFLFTFSSTLFYQQLYEMINQVFAQNTDATTEFFADFFGKITIISLVSQFFITRLVMMIPNPVLGLMIMPFIQFAASAFMLISPALGIVSWGLIINNAINYSTGRAIRELVYIPLNREQKYQGKGFIDTVVFRLGDGLSSIILIGGLELFAYGMWIDWTILVSMAVQFYIIINIARLYSQIVKHSPTQAG